MLHVALERGQRQPDGLWKILHRCKPNGPWVAGGAARRLYFEECLPATSDVDVFFKDQEQFEAFEYWIADDQGGELYHAAKGNDTYTFNGLLVQLIKSYFSSVDHVLSSFDFRMCMFGCDGEQITHGHLAVEDVREKVLVVNKIKWPLYTLARISKYRDQGFHTRPDNCIIYDLSEAARTQLAAGSELGYGDL